MFELSLLTHLIQNNSSLSYWNVISYLSKTSGNTITKIYKYLQVNSKHLETELVI